MAERIFFVAAESSGDLLASEIIREIRHLQPECEMAGIGADNMAAEGVVSPIDISDLSVVGFVEGLKIYKRVVELADAAADEIVAWGADTVALVDSWGFTLRVAQRVRERMPEIRLVKVVGPQVWATRPGRAETLAKVVDHLVCIHAMEVDFYTPFDLPVTVMGNPALSRGHAGDALKGREILGVKPDEQILLVLPGSRRSEIDKVAPTLLAAAQEVYNSRPNTRVIVQPSSNIRPYFIENNKSIESWATLAPVSGDRYDVMAAADYALACSGTVTSELAMQNVPFLVGYHMGWVTWAIARMFLFKPDHITLLNIAADDTEIVPEFVQTKFNATEMAKTAINMLASETARRSQVLAQRKALSRMGEGQTNSARIAAEVLLDRT
ncbi:lipid-A-disaccharide synthase [Henriciella litoralis]|uniref:lipid-A-disaccharide synthase n=1 Tax=Henriciella litoralis TaxID=568102 RepID=UPI000A07651B|nr:lipid-A-disaccharide synthase [Henriciella litoralis]